MTGQTRVGNRWHTCPTCGKRAYSTRRAAKTALRSLPHQGDMGAYRCGDLWHVGHRNGLTRAEHREHHGRNAS